MHLIVEATDRETMSRGVWELAVRLARAVNRALHRRGTVWSDRYHVRALRTPREVRSALVYVLLNFRKHIHGAVGIDPCSSAPGFDGFCGANPDRAAIGVSVVVAIALYVLLRRTRVGAIIRAGVDDRDMVSALGINVRIVFSAVFVLGCALAGFAGVLGVPIVGLASGNDTTILLLALAVVVIGGLGSYEGAILGSLVIAMADTYGTAYFPAVSYSVLFIPLVVVLLIRPQGLLGRRAAL